MYFTGFNNTPDVLIGQCDIKCALVTIKITISIDIIFTMRYNSEWHFEILFLQGKCPYYNTYQGNMDEKDCNSKYGNCPKGQFRSPLSVMCKYDMYIYE